MHFSVTLLDYKLLIGTLANKYMHMEIKIDHWILYSAGYLSVQFTQQSSKLVVQHCRDSRVLKLFVL